jgi:hypothetical protein
MSPWLVAALLCGAAMPLRASDDPSRPVSSDIRLVRQPFLTAGIALSGSGVAAVAAAVPLLLLDGRCATTATDALGDCTDRHNSGPAGIALLSGGIALVATGVSFIVARAAARHRAARRTGSAPAHAPAVDRDDLQARFATGTDAFFNGEFDTAIADLGDIVNRLGAIPVADLDGALVDMDFQSRLYLAMCLRETIGDEPAEDQLRMAFARHPDALPPDRTFPPWLADTSARIRAENSAAENSEPVFANPAAHHGDGRSAVRRPRWKDPAAFVATGIGIALATTGIALGIRYGSHTPQEPAALAMQFAGIALAATGVVLFVVPDWEIRTSRGAGLALSWNF